MILMPVGNDIGENLTSLMWWESRSGCEQEECVCEGVWMCLCVCVLLLLVLTPSSEGKKQRERVRRMGDEFFRGIDEEKQRLCESWWKTIKRNKQLV